MRAIRDRARPPALGGIVTGVLVFGSGLVPGGTAVTAGAPAADSTAADSTAADSTAADSTAADSTAADSTAAGHTALALLRSQATSVRPLVASDLALRFLDAADDLPPIAGTRVVYYSRERQDALTPEDASTLEPEDLAGYEPVELDGEFYYFTRYGTPLAVVRALDLIAGAGLTSVDSRAIVDFGFGSIGHLRLLASLGARIVGLEVDPLLAAFYRDEDDVGSIPRAAVAGSGRRGHLTTLYGHFPADAAIVDAVGDGYDLFISKNTLKRGYIHPERDVDPRMLVHLGVDDETFVQAVHEVLEPGGLFMIYNLHPAPADEDQPYVPWADGRCPFPRELLERSGFEVIAFDVDDTGPARAMGEAFGWSASMDLTEDLFGTYTLLRRRVAHGESP